LGEVRLSNIAERDLLEIWFHIAADNGAETADYWIDRIEARLGQLSMFPQSGPARPDIAPEARMLVISRWLVLYREIPDGGWSTGSSTQRRTWARWISPANNAAAPVRRPSP
jgi:toxin ParE1/3/4